MKQNSLTGFMNEVIVELQEEGRFATANIYKYALRAFTQPWEVVKSSGEV